jgi:hypothetical protein
MEATWFPAASHCASLGFFSPLVSHPRRGHKLKFFRKDWNQSADQNKKLELIKSSPGPYPKEALRKQIEGTVTLRIVVDSHGKVSEAEALNGPTELLQIAVVARQDLHLTLGYRGGCDPLGA